MMGNILGTLFFLLLLFMLWESWLALPRSAIKRFSLFAVSTLIVTLLITAGVVAVVIDIWSSNA